MRFIVLSFLILFIYSCSPKVIVHSQKKFEETKEYENFVTFEMKDTFDINTGEYVGEVKIKDGGLTMDCNYETVLKLAEKEARKLGGNALKIVAHKLPDGFFSSCHRITGNVYKLSDISKYEKKIIWNENRKLKARDFKGSIENRPFEAGTVSYFSYEYSGRVVQGKIKFTVTTIFDCEKSYFKGSQQVDTILAHEQGHFDITELYARKFFKKITEDIKTIKNSERKINQIYDDLVSELYIEQDKYDSDIYPDLAKQAVWLKNLQEELKKYEKYSNKKIFISIF